MTEKEKGASPDQAAPQAFDTANSSATPPALDTLANWPQEKPPRFRGKGKRRTRADAIARKRGDA